MSWHQELVADLEASLREYPAMLSTGSGSTGADEMTLSRRGESEHYTSRGEVNGG